MARQGREGAVLPHQPPLWATQNGHQNHDSYLKNFQNLLYLLFRYLRQNLRQSRQNHSSYQKNFQNLLYLLFL